MTITGATDDRRAPPAGALGAARPPEHPHSGGFLRLSDLGLGDLDPGVRRRLVESAYWLSLDGEPCLPVEDVDAILSRQSRGTCP
jgi:hypothetical protein